ncbi:bifunctional adenosylcobinamide kinase/adenosylcobinamide-phosphate guanylyltransferase [Desulforhopalus sp. IMCC35007]|uniref:bifunctional adenosylcobinamide kinase/adenosylcobinamide-phosphate guanylyltransferase n=1 Tax=Desulforhopalus sp. IMCC35007 TaxID=2569543 RepID=UPI0010ADEADD|nr:bifunctional adenosylcobinamide kinase/adenosylcobinamide-phosphate guanylyltransferase [Desulforhopalus sp. IMCC35007]TKB11090.1 bifunctional adenosylcobinamide kinase/adenosylcobinamide-phosphate guanylyltransferase [Desulforhopalus sp. IMCC35007]
MAKLILITGGARSGKSSYALELCEKFSEKRLFIATCPAIDSEMNERVARHREERKGRGWQTKECPLQLEMVFEEETAEFEVVLLDCVTLWVNNVLFSTTKAHDGLDDQLIKEKAIAWLRAADKVKGTVVCVTNEVGLGIVPDNPLARKYRDLVGTVNQTIGKMADEVILVSCGVPFCLKK